MLQSIQLENQGKLLKMFNALNAGWKFFNAKKNENENKKLFNEHNDQRSTLMNMFIHTDGIV